MISLGIISISGIVIRKILVTLDKKDYGDMIDVVTILTIGTSILKSVISMREN